MSGLVSDDSAAPILDENAASENIAPATQYGAYAVCTSETLIVDAASRALANGTDVDGDQLPATLPTGRIEVRPVLIPTAALSVRLRAPRWPG